MPLTMKGQTRKTPVLVIFSFLLVSLAQADMEKRVDDVISQSLRQKVRFSIHIVEAGTGKTVYEHDANELMIPASNMKLVTTAAALKYLGADYEYITKVGL